MTRTAPLALVLVSVTLAAAACSMDPVNTVKPVNHAHVQTAQPRTPVAYSDAMAPASVVGDAQGLTPATVIRDASGLGSLAGSVPADFDFGQQMLIFVGKERQLERKISAANAVVIVDAEARDPYSPGIHVTDSSMASVVGLTFGCGAVDAPLTPAPQAAPTPTPTATPAPDVTLPTPEIPTVELPDGAPVPDGVPTPEVPTPEIPEAPKDVKLLTNAALAANGSAAATDETTPAPPATTTTAMPAAGWSEATLVLFAVPRIEQGVQVMVQRVPCE